MKLSISLIAFLSIVVLSCSKKEFGLEPTVVSTNEVLGKWKLTRYEDLATGEDLTQPDVQKFGVMTMTFKADNTAGGRINCNGRSFLYSISEGKMSLTKGITTEIGCDESWANNFYKVFENPDNLPHISLNGAVLTLISSNLKRKVTMEKQ
jgi:heat shock protein HslJ